MSARVWLSLAGTVAITFVVGVLSGLAVDRITNWNPRTRRIIASSVLLAAIGVGLGVYTWDLRQRAEREDALENGRVGVTVQIVARAPGESLWSPQVVAQPGDVVEYQIRAGSTGPGIARNLIVGVNASGLDEYVCTSAQLKNSNHPSGETIFDSDSDCPGNRLFTGGINVGHGEPGGVTHVAWKSRVAAEAVPGETLTTVGVVRADRTTEFVNVVNVSIRQL